MSHAYGYLLATVLYVFRTTQLKDGNPKDGRLIENHMRGPTSFPPAGVALWSGVSFSALTRVLASFLQVLHTSRLRNKS